MKQKYKNFSLGLFFALVALVTLGCTKGHKYFDIKVEKEGNLSLKNLNEIVDIELELNLKNTGDWNSTQKDDYIQFRKNYLFKTLSYQGANTPEELAKAYRLDFHVKFLEDENPFVFGFALKPCSLDIKFDQSNQYPAHADGLGEVPNKHYYFDIEKLKSLGYIKKEGQEDLCLIGREVNTGGQEIIYEPHHYTSTTLVYTAAEINEVVAEYERLSGESR